MHLARSWAIFGRVLESRVEERVRLLEVSLIHDRDAGRATSKAPTPWKDLIRIIPLLCRLTRSTAFCNHLKLTNGCRAIAYADARIARCDFDLLRPSRHLERGASGRDCPLHKYRDGWYPVRTASAPERSRSVADTVQLSQIADE